MKLVENTVDMTLALICQRAIRDPAPFDPWPSDMRKEIGRKLPGSYVPFLLSLIYPPYNPHGTIVYALLVLTSIVGLTFIVERGLSLRWRKVVPPEIEAAVHILPDPRGRADARAASVSQYPSPMSRLLLMAAEHLDWPKADTMDAMQARARHEVTRLERGLVVLEMIVGIAPLLGLVGTIIGMMGLFRNIGQRVWTSRPAGPRHRPHPQHHAHGPSHRHPFAVFWSYYSKKVETIAIEMETLCDEFIRRQYREAPGRDGPGPPGSSQEVSGQPCVSMLKKRRQPPAVIIVALIDILIVLLIFLMVTTSFSRMPAVKLALPESTTARRSRRQRVAARSIVTIDAQGNVLLGAGTKPLTLAQFKTELVGGRGSEPGPQGDDQRGQDFALRPIRQGYRCRQGGEHQGQIGQRPC